MTRHEIASLALKILGIYALISAIPLVGLPFTVLTEDFRAVWAFTLASVVSCIHYLAVGILLIRKSDSYAHLMITPETPELAVAKASAHELQAVAFSIVGAVAVVFALPYLVGNVAALFHDRSATRSLLTSVVQILLGLWLFLSGATLARLWRRARGEWPRHPDA